jgi:hypothetical protein
VTWLSILIAVAVSVALVALSGARPNGARPVARTNLMMGARVVLVILIAAITWAVWAR